MELFKLLGTIAIDNTEANTAIESTTKKAKEGQITQSEAFEKIGATATKISAGLGIVGVAMGGAFIAAVEGTREYRVEMAKLDTAFVTNGHSSSAAKQTYSDLNAVLGDSGQAVEAANHLALLTDNEKDLQTWTDICTGVYATFGDSLPIEGLTEAANETAKTGILTGGLTDALNWAGISEEKFQEKLDSCTNEQERQKLIMDTLNGTYKEASTQYQETNKDVIASQKAQERLKDALAEVGRVGEPVMTAIKNAIAGMAEKAVPVISGVINKIKDMAKWIKDNEEKVKLWAAMIGIAIGTVGGFILVMSWSSIMTKAKTALNLVTVAVKALNVAMRANIIGLVVTAILGLVAAFVYLWRECEGFRKFWIKLWDGIKSLASKSWVAIKKYFSDAWKSIKNTWNGAKSYFSGIWSSIKNTFSNLPSWFGSIFKKAWSNIKSAFSSWGSFFSGLWTKIKSKFSSIGSSLGSAMSGAVKSGMNTVISKVEGSINKGIDLINSAITLANKLPIVNVGNLSRISLPRLAMGGVITDETPLIAGEDGAEAIVPLEKNTQWLDRIAERLNVPRNDSLSDAKLDRIIFLLERMIDHKTDIYLDSGVLVGAMAPGMDKRLGSIALKKDRRNI